jgi:hypothetical protein
VSLRGMLLLGGVVIYIRIFFGHIIAAKNWGLA